MLNLLEQSDDVKNRQVSRGPRARPVLKDSQHPPVRSEVRMMGVEVAPPENREVAVYQTVSSSEVLGFLVPGEAFEPDIVAKWVRLEFNPFPFVCGELAIGLFDDRPHPQYLAGFGIRSIHLQ